MKTINRVLQILTIAFGLAAVVLFFFKFVTITAGANSYNASGVQLAFGIKLAGMTGNLAKSADLTFCFLMTVIGFVMSALTFKSKKVRYAAPAFGLVTAIYMLVVTCSFPKHAHRFIDARSIVSDSALAGIKNTSMILICTLVLFLFTICGVAYLLVDDRLEVAASKGAKLTIPQRIARFFRDYKSEVKKIVWPGFRDVVKNTLIVLVICLLIGILIWVCDKGLGELIKWIMSGKA